MRVSRFLIAAVFVALAACGGKGLGGDKMPGGLGGSSGMVAPNSCGNYASSEAGARLKVFLAAVADLQQRSSDAVMVVRASCQTMGKELGMSDADFADGMETKDVCAKVWGVFNENMKVAVKGKAAFKINYKPAVCRISVMAAAAKCEGKASADVGATRSGTCRGTCDGECSGAGNAGTGGTAGFPSICPARVISKIEVSAPSSGRSMCPARVISKIDENRSGSRLPADRSKARRGTG